MNEEQPTAGERPTVEPPEVTVSTAPKTTEQEVPVAPVVAAKEVTEVPVAPVVATKEVTEAPVAPVVATKEVTEVPMAPVVATKEVTEVPVAPVVATKEVTEVPVAPAVATKEVTEVPVAPAVATKEVTEVPVAPVVATKEVTEVPASNVVADEADEAKAAPTPVPKAVPKQRRVTVNRVKLARPKPPTERINELKRHDTDVGSSEIQIGLLTDRILHLTAHLKIHPKDNHTNYGLRKLVSQRKRLLKYLSRTKPEIHKKVKVVLNMR